MLPISSMVSLLRGVSRFVNRYMGEGLVKCVTNFINDLFVKEDV